MIRFPIAVDLGALYCQQKFKSSLNLPGVVFTRENKILSNSMKKFLSHCHLLSEILHSNKA